MVDKNRNYLLILIIGCNLVVLLFVIAIAIKIVIPFLPISPSRAFRKFVSDPIPKSVKDIKIDREVKLLGRDRYILHFHIDEADLSPILNARPYQKVKYIKYSENGLLRWESPRGSSHSLHLYSLYSGETEPEWFILERWDSPKAYILAHKINAHRVRFLVYNKELGEAYFIDIRFTDEVRVM